MIETLGVALVGFVLTSPSPVLRNDYCCSTIYACTPALQDLLNVIESTKLLKEAQAKEDSPEAKASLPTLAVKDLEREIKSIPIAVDSVQGVKVVTHDIPSSGESVSQ